MIRIILIGFLLISAAALAESVDAQIKKTSASLKHFDRNFASVNARMAQTAKSILKKERTVLRQRKDITGLEKSLSSKASTLSKSRSELESLTTKQETVEAGQRQLRNDLAQLLARVISLAMMQDDNNTLSPDAIMSEEIFKALNLQTQQQIKALGADYRKNQKMLRSLTGKTAQLRTEISAIERQKRTLEKEKRANEKALAELRGKKARYKKEIKKLLAQKNALKNTLSRLQIIRESKAQKAQAKAEQQRNEALLASKPLPKVKSVGSSYHKARTRRYRGRKTIAPLDHYTVLKRYGTYTDPIYHIKIFNESVSLKPTARNAKVKTIFNGKVILAQNTPLLDNVVIIEHANGLHTIYAHLDRIAPTISKGKRLKKGSVIGRVNDELMFEVTQKNYHIDPLQVIR